MIKNFEAVELPNVELGNLGLHNACSYYVDKDSRNYPKAIFGKPGLNGGFLMQFDHVSNCPEDYEFVDRYETPMERLLDYAQSLKNEWADCDDVKLASFNFQGRKHTARQHDEMRRRGFKNV